MENNGGREKTNEEVLDLSPLATAPEPQPVGDKRKVEQTRAVLAYLLFGLLSTVILLLLWFLAEGWISGRVFQDAAGILIAPIVGLLGAATGYYYGKGDR